MKIPKSIRIGGIDYEIIDNVPGLNDGEHLLYGRISYNNSVIEIADTQEHQMKCVTLWHEILHGIEMQAQLELGEESETIIQAFARGVYQVLQDNGGRLFDLREVSK